MAKKQAKPARKPATSERPVKRETVGRGAVIKKGERARKPAKEAAPREVAPATTAATSPGRKRREGTKRGLLIGLLRRPGGATIEALVEALGWQSHTVRAAFSGLRKEGMEVLREKGDDGSIYRLPG